MYVLKQCWGLEAVTHSMTQYLRGRSGASITMPAACRERRPVIEQVGKELLEVNEEGLEQVEGHRVVELLATTPIASQEDSDSARLNGKRTAIFSRSTCTLQGHVPPTSCRCCAVRQIWLDSAPES